MSAHPVIVTMPNGESKDGVLARFPRKHDVHIMVLLDEGEYPIPVHRSRVSTKKFPETREREMR